MDAHKCPEGGQLIDIVMVPGGYYCTSCHEAVPTFEVMAHAEVPQVQKVITEHYPTNTAECEPLEDGSTLRDGSKLEIHCNRCSGHVDYNLCHLLTGLNLRRAD